jgi:DNA polymerase-3 subunit gamma/tau
MSLQVLYRPKSFKTFAGNDEIKKNLQEIVKRKNPPSSFLIVGPSGCGKTTLGRIIAKVLGCKKDDYKEMNAASDRTLPAIRAILDDMKYTPMAGKKKVVLFDEVHGILGATQEALLKGLEEPPSHVHFILCTTNPEALKDTFKRRCHIYEVQPLNSNQMMKHLKSILKKEKVKDFKEPVLEKIIELSNGSPGIALKYLDMVIDITDEEEAINLLKTSGTSEKDVLELCRTLVDFRVNGKTRWGKIRKILLNFNGDAESARRPILGYLNTCLLKNPEGDNFALIMDEFKDSFMYSGKAGLSLACYKAVFMIED